MKQPGPATASLVVISQAVHFLTFSGFALLLPLIREDLKITFAQAGLLSAAATVSYAAAQVPSGFGSDRWGPKRLFVAGLAGWSLLALALSFVSSYWVAAAILVAGGACRALLFAPGLALVSSCFPAKRRATGMSVFLLGAFLGTMAVSLTGPRLSAWVGWRTAFASYALLGLAAAVAFLVFAAERPPAREARRVGLADAKRLLRHRIVWLCNGLQLVRFSIFSSFNFWLPSFLTADRGLSLESAGLAVAVSAACAAFANPLGGYVSDRLRNPPLVIGGSLTVVACTSMLLATVHSTPLLLAVVALQSVFMTIYFGPLFVVPVEAFGQRTAGLATGINNLFANLGALVSAYALGALKDATGSFAPGFYAMAALCAVGVVLSVILARVRTGLTPVPAQILAVPGELRHAVHAGRH